METTDQNNNSNNGMKKIFISVTVAMTLIIGVTVYFLFNEKQEKQVVIEQKTSLESDYKAVSDTLDARKQDIEQLRGKNSELDNLITQKEAMIDEEKRDLDSAHNNNTLTVASLDKARSVIAQNEVTIATLHHEIDNVKQENRQLTADKQQLGSDLNCEKETTAQLTDQNQGLSKKVVAGSYLQIPKVDVQAFKRKHNGEEIPTEKAKTAESLRVSFETGVNKVLDPGPVCFYVRIINPRGETMAISEQGSGTIPDLESAKPVQYTKKADINYTQTNKKVVVNWNRNVSDPGLYRVEIYQSGKVIGKGSVHLI